MDLSAIGEPRWIVCESIERMFASVGDYDVFLNIEDDVLDGGVLGHTILRQPRIGTRGIRAHLSAFHVLVPRARRAIGLG